MKKLFDIMLNDDGLYVYPITNSPRYNVVHGDEIRPLQEAMALRDSLNHAVETHISLLVINNPVELLRRLGKQWGWKTILEHISDLLWHRYLDTKGATPQSAIYQNMMAVGRVAVSWSK